MQYWLLIGGTNEDPVQIDWQAQDQRWPDQGNSPVFNKRPTIKSGDRLIVYASGSPKRTGAGRIYKVLEVVGEPTPNEGRWPWRVSTRKIIAGPLLDACPTLADINVNPKSVRRNSHIRLTEEQGILAEELLSAASS
jgi:hypothetical protein